MKKLMTEIRPMLLPLLSILSLVLFMCCLRELVYTEDLILKELCKSLTVVATLLMLAAVSNTSIPKSNETNENH